MSVYQPPLLGLAFKSVVRIYYPEMPVTLQTDNASHSGYSHDHWKDIRFKSEKQRSYIHRQCKCHCPQDTHTVVKEYVQYYYLYCSDRYRRYRNCDLPVFDSLLEHLHLGCTIIVRHMIQKFIYHGIKTTVYVFSEHHHKPDEQYQKRNIPQIPYPRLSRLEYPAEKQSHHGICCKYQGDIVRTLY